MSKKADLNKLWKEGYYKIGCMYYKIGVNDKGQTFAYKKRSIEEDWRLDSSLNAFLGLAEKRFKKIDESSTVAKKKVVKKKRKKHVKKHR